jgi:hypothetical protein
MHLGDPSPTMGYGLTPKSYEKWRATPNKTANTYVIEITF